MELNIGPDYKAVVTTAKEDIKTYIPSIEDQYLEKFIIANNELCYIGDDPKEIEAAKTAKINTDLSSNNAAQDIINIYSNVLPIDETATDKQIGTILYDKDYTHNDDWNLIITYNSDNTKKAEYGTGYRYLTPGTYTIDENTITIYGNYVLDYKTKNLVALNNYKNWNAASTLAVSDNLVLNIDPTNLSGNDWRTDSSDSSFQDYYVNGVNTGIQKTGDVVYDSGSKSLKFNEDSTNNPDGNGGYLKLTKPGDFSNGFSFEIYANLDRLRYDNKNTISDYTMGATHSGLFCRMPSLSSAYGKTMKFGYNREGTICRLFDSSSWQGIGKILQTYGEGSILLSNNNCGYKVNEDFYLTFVYIAYDEAKSLEYKTNFPEEYNSDEGNYDAYMDKYYKEYSEGKHSSYVDKVLYYVNGKLYGYTYYGHDSYEAGCNTWNKDTCPFFVGVCPWYADGNLYYLKGNVYTCRLYQRAMLPSEVKDNRNATMQYRNSF